MSEVVPYVFEGAQIRVIAGDDGEPWFVGNDVAAALGYEDARRAVAQHVADDDRVERPVIDSIGRKQKTNCINESGLYALIMGSKLEGAKRFKRWVTSEVLPSIRKTGSYTAPSAPLAPRLPTRHEIQLDTARVAAEVANRMLALAGATPGIAAAAGLAVFTANSNADMEPARLLLPGLATAMPSLNATEVGKEMGMGARSANAALAELGLQVRNARNEWELTEAGREHGEAIPFGTGKHSGYQVRWRPSVLEFLRRGVTKSA